GRARYLVLGEVVDGGVAGGDEVGHDVATHVMRAARVESILLDGLNQSARRKHIVSHGSEDLLRVVAEPCRFLGLLMKGADPACIIRFDHAEAESFIPGDPNPRYRHARA